MTNAREDNNFFGLIMHILTHKSELIQARLTSIFFGNLRSSLRKCQAFSLPAFLNTPIAKHLPEIKTVTNLLDTIYSLYYKKLEGKAIP